MPRFKTLIFVLFLLIGSKTQAQIFYEVNWKQDNVAYYGLLIYYNTDDAVMRIRYKINDEYKVAEFKCQYKKMDIKGREGYILDGIDAQIVYGNKTSSTYSPDNFYFYKNGDGYDTPYTIDDAHLAKDNPSQYFLKVDKWEKIATSKFTESFVRNYFEKEEPLYNKLLAYNIQGNKTDNGYRVSSATFATDQWFVCMSKGTGYTQQSTYREKAFPTDWVKKKWVEGKEISDISYGNGEWLVVMSTGTKYTTQLYYSEAIFPAGAVKEKQALGYMISSIAYAEGKWLVVMSKGSGITNQEIYFNATFPTDWVKEKWTGKYRVTAMAFGDGKWAVVMAQNTGIGMQSYKSWETFPEEYVKAYWAKDYEISSSAYGNGKWYIMMVQESGITKQTYNITTTYPRDWVQEKWDNKESGAVAAVNTNTITPQTTSKIYLLVVANTMISDIGTSCKVDEDRVVNEFTIFAKEMDMGLSTRMIDGSNYSKATLDAELNQLNPGPNDIVVFIYSGHGFRWTNQTSQYPSISLKYSAYERVAESNSYLLSDIYKKITDKGARLNIIIGDCCNSSIGISSRGGDFALSSRSGNNGNTSKLRQLFETKRGNILIAAASPNETSCGNSRDGGYLISSFFQAIGKETSYLNNDTPDWSHVIANAINSARFSTQNLSGCTTQNGMQYSTVK